MSAFGQKRLSRRQMMTVATVGVAALTVVGTGAKKSEDQSPAPRLRDHLAATWERYRFRHLSFEEAITRHFHYLDLDPEGVSLFASSYRKVHGKRRRNLAAVYLDFLLSSDFFRNGGDESKTVRFIALYAPSDSLCANPCAQFE